MGFKNFMSLFAIKIPTIVIDVKHLSSNHRGELFGMSWKFQKNWKRIRIHFQSDSGMYWQITYLLQGCRPLGYQGCHLHPQIDLARSVM